jgi:hypothetical protein
MQFAKLSKEFVLHYFDEAGAGPFSAISANIYLTDGTLVKTASMRASTGEPGLYVSAAITMTTVGKFVVKIADSSAGDLQSFNLTVGTDNVSDFEPGVAATFAIDAIEIGDAVSTVTVAILNFQGALVTSLPASYDATLNAYKSTSYTFTTQANYFLVWYDDGVADFAQRIWVVAPDLKELVELWVGYTNSSGTSVPQAGVTVVISDAGGAPVLQSSTDSGGYVRVNLFPGTYTVSLSRGSDVFSVNNFTLVVSDTDLTANTNKFQYLTSHFTPTVSSPTTPAICTISGFLLRMNGLPMPDIEVVVEQVGGPISSAGSVFFKDKLIYVTDKNGFVQFSLIQGVEVVITIYANSLRRRVTVPATSTANLFTLMSSADDPFDIVVPTIPDAIRRS